MIARKTRGRPVAAVWRWLVTGRIEEPGPRPGEASIEVYARDEREARELADVWPGFRPVTVRRRGLA